MVNYYEFWQPTDAASIVLQVGSKPVMELLLTEDGKRQLLALLCPVLPAKAPFQNQTAVAPLCVIRATNPGHLAEGGSAFSVSGLICVWWCPFCLSEQDGNCGLR